MSIAINGIGEVVITLKTTTTVAVGDFVTLSSSGVAATAATTGVEPIGVCVSQNGDSIGVQIAGGVKVPQDGTLTVGYCCIKTSSDGLAKGTTGTPRLVVNVTTDTADIIL